jgi:hypothetical protein
VKAREDRMIGGLDLFTSESLLVRQRPGRTCRNVRFAPRS